MRSRPRRRKGRRVPRGLEKETKFASAKSAADAAVKAKDWQKAITEYQAALKVYPQKTDVQALLKSAKENAHKDAVQKALAKGFAYEKAYQWREARDAYHETLELEPDQPEAKEGYTRAGTVIRALLQYEQIHRGGGGTGEQSAVSGRNPPLQRSDGRQAVIPRQQRSSAAAAQYF